MSWVKFIETEEIKDGKLYFIGRKPVTPTSNSYPLLWSQPLKGKPQWTIKPGIAIKYEGSDELREVLRKNPQTIAIEVPANYKTRWKARKARCK